MEAINPSRTSVEVSLFNDGNRHWFDITMGQVALFSTRAGVMDGDLDGMQPLISQEDIFVITDLVERDDDHQWLQYQQITHV